MSMWPGPEDEEDDGLMESRAENKPEEYDARQLPQEEEIQDAISRGNGVRRWLSRVSGRSDRRRSVLDLLQVFAPRTLPHKTLLPT
jgi:hypothetical protein